MGDTERPLGGIKKGDAVVIKPGSSFSEAASDAMLLGGEYRFLVNGGINHYEVWERHVIAAMRADGTIWHREEAR